MPQPQPISREFRHYLRSAQIDWWFDSPTHLRSQRPTWTNEWFSTQLTNTTKYNGNKEAAKLNWSRKQNFLSRKFEGAAENIEVPILWRNLFVYRIWEQLRFYLHSLMISSILWSLIAD